MESKQLSVPRKISSALFNSQGTPIILALSVLAILFILFRMKSIEQDYKYNDYNTKIENELFENKELKAKKAKLLSVKNLRVLAKKFALEQPREEQIIVIP